jgi:hypothetical protein
MRKTLSYKSKKRRLYFATVFLSLFLIVGIPVETARAACCAADAVTAANTSNSFVSWLTQIGLSAATVTDILSILNFFQNNIAPAIAAQTTANVSTGIFQQLATYNAASYQASMGMYAQSTKMAAQNQQNAILSNQSNACQWSVLGQSIDQADQCVGALAATLQVMLSHDCKGKLANCRGPGRPKERFNDLCQLGFVSPQDAANFPQDNCQPPPQNDMTYIGRHKNYLACLLADQMPLPPSVCILADGYVSFSGPPPGQQCQQGTGNNAAALYNPDVSQSALAWVGCYKACENLDPGDDKTPFVTNGNPTSADYETYMKEQAPDAGRLGLRAACMNALWERTAIPQSTAGVTQLIGNGNSTNTINNCAQAQAAVCSNMFNSANPNGMFDPGGGMGPANYVNVPTGVGGQTGVGIQGDQAVQNCFNAGAGLSTVNRERIISERCQDTNYMGQRGSHVKDGSVIEQDANFTCNKERTDWEEKKKQEIRVLLPLFFNAFKANRGDADPVP